MRKIDKLYAKRDEIAKAIELWQSQCKHRKTKAIYTIGLPGISGNFDYCTTCDKQIRYSKEQPQTTIFPLTWGVTESIGDVQSFNNQL